jgi:hypothetical protein
LGVLSKNESVRTATNSKGETKRAVEPERKARAA